MKIKTKAIVTSTVLLLSLIGCHSAKPEDKFLGNWTQVNTNGHAPIAAKIVKQDERFEISLTLPLPNHDFVTTKQFGKFEDGKLVANGIEKISIDDTTGHMRIGANEFAKAE
jgi:hypothetical protein